MPETIAAMCKGPVDEARKPSTSDSPATNCGIDKSVSVITRRRKAGSSRPVIQSKAAAS